MTMNYFKLEKSLADDEVAFEIDIDTPQHENHPLYADNFINPNFTITNWLPIELHLFRLTEQDKQQYFEDEYVWLDDPSVYTDYRQVWGMSSAGFSDKLMTLLHDDLTAVGQFLPAYYLDEKWYFYHCERWVKHALDIANSEITYFQDGRIMVLHQPVLFANHIKGLDVFRLYEAPSDLIVSEKIQDIFLKNNIRGAKFTPIELTN